MPAAAARSRSIRGPGEVDSTSSRAKPTSSDCMPARCGAGLRRAAAVAPGLAFMGLTKISDPPWAVDTWIVPWVQGPPATAQSGLRRKPAATQQDIDETRHLQRLFTRRPARRGVARSLHGPLCDRHCWQTAAGAGRLELHVAAAAGP